MPSEVHSNRFPAYLKTGSQISTALRAHPSSILIGTFPDIDNAFPEFFDDTPRRIDYIFEKGFSVETGEVVFNPNASPPEPLEPVVSDHAGVLVRLVFNE